MYKIKRFIRLIFLICVIALIAILIKVLFFDKDEEKNRPGYNSQEEVEGNINNIKPIDINNYITDTYENNKDIIKEYIADGMPLEDFKNSLSKSNNYIKTTEKYIPVQYNFEKHYKYSELSNLYEELAKSEIVKVEIIGKSVDNRNIYSIEIGTGKDKVMLEGNIHAAEIAPTLYLTKLAVDLVNEWESGNSDTLELLSNHKIVILPSVNPDGYDYSIFGKDILNTNGTYVYKNDDEIEQAYFKANINGVDINRNMPSQLSGLYFKSKDLYYTVSRDKSSKRLRYFGGYSVGSEPESKALIYWMYKHYEDTHAYIALHSAGRVIYNGKPHLSDEFNEYSSKCADEVNKYTRYTILGVEDEIDGDGTDGTSTDMIAEISHNYKFSSNTGRLSTSEYDIVSNDLAHPICVLTVETLESYTQSLTTIQEEWNKRKIKQALLGIIKLEL